MFIAIYLIVWFVGSAMMAREGLWSNTITFVNIVVSGLVAFGFYAPLTIRIDEYTEGKNTYFLDFVVIWFLFSVTAVILRALTRLLSATRMRFKHPIDPIGGTVMSEIASWVLATIVMASLHTAPMGQDAFGGGLVKSADVANASGFFTFAFQQPDAAWLKFMESMTAPTAFGNGVNNQFKARAWVQIYEEHRAAFDKSESVRVRRG